MNTSETSEESRGPYEVFISYDRSQDIELAKEIHRHLQSEKIRVFKDDAALPPGSGWIGRIEEALNEVHTFLRLGTERNPTGWVAKETELAMLRQALSGEAQRPRIIPVVAAGAVKSASKDAESKEPGFVDLYQRVILDRDESGIRRIALEKLVWTIKQSEMQGFTGGYSSPAKYLRKFVSFQQRFEEELYQPREELEKSLHEAAVRLNSTGGYIVLAGSPDLGKKWVAWRFAKNSQHFGAEEESYGENNGADQKPVLAMWFGHEASPRQALQELLTNTGRALDISKLRGESLEQWLLKMDAGVQVAANLLLRRLGEEARSKAGNFPQVIPVLDATAEHVRWLPERCEGIVFLITTSERLFIAPEYVEEIRFRPEYNRRALIEYILKKASAIGYEYSIDRKHAESIAVDAKWRFVPVDYLLENSPEHSPQIGDKSAKLREKQDEIRLIGRDWPAAFFDRARARGREAGIHDTELRALFGVLAGLQRTTVARSFVRSLFSSALASERFPRQTVQWTNLYRNLDSAVDALEGRFLRPLGKGVYELSEDAFHPFVKERLLADSEWRRCQEFIAIGCREAWSQHCDIQSYAVEHLLPHLQQGLPYTADAFCETLISDFLLQKAKSKALTLVDSARLVLERLLVLTRQAYIWRYSSVRESLLCEASKPNRTYDQTLRLALILAMAGESLELSAATTTVSAEARRNDFLAMLGVSSVVALDMVRARGCEPSVLQLVQLLVRTYEEVLPSRLNGDISCWLSGQANGLALALDGSERLEADEERRRLIQLFRYQLSATAFRLYAVPQMLNQKDPDVWEILLWRSSFAGHHDFVVTLVEQMPDTLKQAEPEFAAENYRIAAHAALQLWRDNGAVENRKRYTRFLSQASRYFNRFLRKEIPGTGKINSAFPKSDWERSFSRLVRDDKPTCLIVSNEYDSYMGLGLELALQYRGERASVVHIGSLPVITTCDGLVERAYEIFNTLRVLILLGGTKAPQGIGQIVLGTLKPDQEYLLTSEEFRGERLCLLYSQQLFIIAGNGRVATRKAILECIRAVTDDARVEQPVEDVLRDISKH